MRSDTISASWSRFLGWDHLPQQIHKTHICKVDTQGFKTDALQPQISWLGHATFAIVWDNTTLMIDPVFSHLVGLMPRRIPVRKSIQSLKPDGILVSHAHMDHLDKRTLAQLPPSTLVLPKKTETYLPDHLPHQLQTVELGDEINLGSLKITCTAARHGGWRYPWHRGYFACSYLIQGASTTLFYAGDTGYGDHFKMIGNTYRVDVALLPIGAYSPRWFLKSRHLNPPEAVQASLDLDADLAIPFHFGSYRLSLDPLNEAFPWFVEEAKKAHLNWSLPYDF